MKIYTKKGDTGSTQLFGGVDVFKDDHRLRVYGGLDELNANVGVGRVHVEALSSTLDKELFEIQSELFQLGTELATPEGKPCPIKLLDNTQTLRLEAQIDGMEALLPPLRNFVLPGGTAAAAHLHLSRVVARRVERDLVEWIRGSQNNLAKPEAKFEAKFEVRPEVLQYLNRLSDYFFVAARYCNYLGRVQDIPWISPKKAQ